MSNPNLNEALATLCAKVGSKSDYLPRTLDEARADFIGRAKETVVVLREGKVRPYHPAPMAKQQKITKMFCVKIGYGGNNAYMANSIHKASQVLKYDTAEEAASAIEATIIPLAESHTFDEALEATLMEHKERSEHRRMVAEANREAQEGELANGTDEVPEQAA